jgi:thioredoxin-like negative regulator of GroEL
VPDRAQLTYFTSPRSDPARRVESLLDQVLQERRNNDSFDRTVVDVDADRSPASRFAVDAVPTILAERDPRRLRLPSPRRARLTEAGA